MFFKKRQTNQNKTRHPGRKRKIIATIALSLSLLFGKARLSSSQSSSLNFDNKVVQERIIDDQEFCSFEENDQQVILVKNNSSSPTVRPGLATGFSSKPRVNRPAGASSLKPVRANPVRGFRTPRGLITGQPVTSARRERIRLGGADNPGGNNGGASSNDQCPVSKEQKSQESKTYDYQSKKKKQSAEQCDLDENVKDAKVEIVYRIKENPALVREAERAGRDQDAQRSINNLVEQLSLGNRNPGIGTENVFKDVYELRGKNRARVYYREVGGKIEILGKSVKSNQQKVINILKKMYD